MTKNLPKSFLCTLKFEKPPEARGSSFPHGMCSNLGCPRHPHSLEEVFLSCCFPSVMAPGCSPSNGLISQGWTSKLLPSRSQPPQCLAKWLPVGLLGAKGI